MSNSNTYATIKISDLDLIIFSEILETSAETIRKNIAGDEFIIKWVIEPTFIIDGTVIPTSEINYTEYGELMNTSKWSEHND